MPNPECISPGTRYAMCSGTPVRVSALRHPHLSYQPWIKSQHADFQTTQCFLQRLLEGAANRHHLTNRLHLGGQASIGLGEFFKVKTRDLGYDIVDRGLEGRRSYSACDVVIKLIKGVAHGQFCRDLCDREAGGLGGQCRRSGHPRVHLDHHDTAIFWTDTKLNI